VRLGASLDADVEEEGAAVLGIGGASSRIHVLMG
jgi:hypothetical protein